MSAFVKFLSEQRGGVLHDDLNDKLRELIAAVAAEGKGGKIVLTIGIKPAEKSDGAVFVTDDVKVTIPAPKKSSSIFYTSPENNLVRDDPRQTKMELREVGPSATTLRNLA